MKTILWTIVNLYPTKYCGRGVTLWTTLFLFRFASLHPFFFPGWGITGNMCNIGATAQWCVPKARQTRRSMYSSMQSGAIWTLKFGKHQYRQYRHCGQQCKKNLMTFPRLAKNLIKLQYFRRKNISCQFVLATNRSIHNLRKFYWHQVLPVDVGTN